MAGFGFITLLVFISSTNGKLVYKTEYDHEIPKNLKIPANHKPLFEGTTGRTELESMKNEIERFPKPHMGHYDPSNWEKNENLNAYYNMNNWHSDALKRVDSFAEDERADLLGIAPKRNLVEKLKPSRAPPAQMNYYVTHHPPVLPAKVFKAAKKFSSKYRKLPKSQLKKKTFRPTLTTNNELMDEYVRRPLKDKRKIQNVKLLPTNSLNSEYKDTPISWARQEHYPDPNHMMTELGEIGGGHGERTHFQMHGMNGPHSYKFGYDTGKGHNRQFRFEERDNAGKVSGHYGHYDQHGRMSMVKYEADPHKGYLARPHHFHHHTTHTSARNS